MAHVVIPDIAPRIAYLVTTADNGPFSVPFTFFATADLKVYRGLTLLVEVTDYTVTGTPGSDGGYPGGSVDLVANAENTTITIFRDQAIARTSDFPSAGAFNIATLNSTLDKLVGMLQQLENRIERSLHLPATDGASVVVTLPVAADRAGKFLKFDASGNAAVAADGIALMNTTSVTSHDLTAGAKTFALAETTAVVPVGTWLRFIDAGNPTTKSMSFQVTASAAGSVTGTVAAADIVGSGSAIVAWAVVPTGSRGTTGQTGDAGTNGTSAQLVTDGTVRTGSFNATAGLAYNVNTSGGVSTPTLPADALLVGDELISFDDVAASFGTNACTLTAGAGSTIMGAATFPLNVSYVGARLRYRKSTTDWRIVL